jgi:hypothetical protein
MWHGAASVLRLDQLFCWVGNFSACWTTYSGRSAVMLASIRRAMAFRQLGLSRVSLTIEKYQYRYMGKL